MFHKRWWLIKFINSCNMGGGGGRGGLFIIFEHFVMFFELLLKHQSIGFDQVEIYNKMALF